MAMQGMFLCQASHECVDTAVRSANQREQHGYRWYRVDAKTFRPKSHILIPNPDKNVDLGKYFVKTQDCVTECNECYSPGKQALSL